MLDFLKLFHPLKDFPLSIVTYKLIMLLALSTGQRNQTLHAMDIKEIKFGKKNVFCLINKMLKHNNINRRNDTIVLKPYPKDSALCVVTALRTYLRRTKTIRKNVSQLFISFNKPHAAVSKDTISRWIMTVLREAGVDVDIFKSHSTRAASVSGAIRMEISAEEIMKTVGWSTASTFAKFYNKIIQEDMSNALLDGIHGSR